MGTERVGSSCSEGDHAMRDRRNGQVWFCRDLGSGGRCVKHANLPEMIP